MFFTYFPVFLRFSHGFSIVSYVFPWFFHDIFPWFPIISHVSFIFSHGFPMVFLVKVHLPPARCPRTNCWAPVAALHPHESGRGGPPRPTEATISRWEWSKWSSRNHGLVGNSPIYWEYSMGFFVRIAKRTYCWFSREFPQGEPLSYCCLVGNGWEWGNGIIITSKLFGKFHSDTGKNNLIFLEKI